MFYHFTDIFFIWIIYFSSGHTIYNKESLSCKVCSIILLIFSSSAWIIYFSSGHTIYITESLSCKVCFIILQIFSSSVSFYFSYGHTIYTAESLSCKVCSIILLIFSSSGSFILALDIPSILRRVSVAKYVLSFYKYCLHLDHLF